MLCILGAELLSLERDSSDESKEGKDSLTLSAEKCTTIELKSTIDGSSVTFKAKQFVPVSSLISQILKLRPTLENGCYVHEVPFSQQALFILEELWKFAIYNDNRALTGWPIHRGFSDIAEALELCCYLLMKPFFLTSLEWVLNSRIGIPQELYTYLPLPKDYGAYRPCFSGRRCFVRTKKKPQPRNATIMLVLGNTVFIQYDKKRKQKARPDENPYTCKPVPIKRITLWQPQELGLSRENALIVDNLVRLYGKHLPALSSYEHEYSKCPAPLMRFKESKLDLAVQPLESFVLAQDLLECI